MTTTTNKKDIVINLTPSQYPWNNISKDTKRWNTNFEKSFQYFRFALYNEGGDYSYHPHLFKMLIELSKLQTIQEYEYNVTVDHNNMGFQITDARVLTKYAKRLRSALAKDPSIDCEDQFSDTELLDMKIRLHCYTMQYYKLVGCPGYNTHNIKLVENAATASDFKRNDVAINFLKQFEV